MVYTIFDRKSKCNKNKQWIETDKRREKYEMTVYKR